MIKRTIFGILMLVMGFQCVLLILGFMGVIEQGGIQALVRLISIMFIWKVEGMIAEDELL